MKCQTWTHLALLATLYSNVLFNHMTHEIRCWESDPVMEKYECCGHQGVNKVMTLTETLWPLVWTWTYIVDDNLWPSRFTAPSWTWNWLALNGEISCTQCCTMRNAQLVIAIARDTFYKPKLQFKEFFLCIILQCEQQ